MDIFSTLRDLTLKESGCFYLNVEIIKAERQERSMSSLTLQPAAPDLLFREARTAHPVTGAPVTGFDFPGSRRSSWTTTTRR